MDHGIQAASPRAKLPHPRPAKPLEYHVFVQKEVLSMRQKKHVDISGYYNINVFAKKKLRYAGTQTDLPSDPLTCQNKICYMDVVKMLKRHSIKNTNHP
jgi:hypothetical protein